MDLTADQHGQLLELPPTLYKEIKSLLQGMVDAGVIQESTSQWAAPIVLVRKKNGEWRFCVFSAADAVLSGGPQLRVAVNIPGDL